VIGSEWRPVPVCPAGRLYRIGNPWNRPLPRAVRAMSLFFGGGHQLFLLFYQDKKPVFTGVFIFFQKKTKKMHVQSNARLLPPVFINEPNNN
jgi:hypothetical protein